MPVAAKYRMPDEMLRGSTVNRGEGELVPVIRLLANDGVHLYPVYCCLGNCVQFEHWRLVAENCLEREIVGLFLLGLTGAWRLAWNLTCRRHEVDGDGDNDDDDSTKIWDFNVAIIFSFSSFEYSVYFYD
ncbi:uncharacterized protein A4U43_C10F4150 [Asparagus officinalis]|uniref:Uncharacterized protein n=1 Tax=Asparagus officinalis TaxID=4686 RepID=A0A5P1E0J7_ASPOF|nr:uncharacterized protein A4U43_C10F4150 [Asparagus officinalis]